MRNLIITIIALSFSLFSMSGQNSLLDQYIFSSDDDSMLIVDYLDPNTNYVFTLYGDWCAWCKKELRDYEDIYPQWKEDFNMTFVVLDDYGSDNIEQSIQALSDYPYDVFVTKAIRMPLGVTGFPRNYFVSTDKQLVYEKPGYASPEDMTELLDQLFDKNLKSNLPSMLAQGVKRYDNCEAQWAYGQLSTEAFEMNNEVYQKYSLHDVDYYIREDSDFSKVYIYDEQEELEHILIDFSKEICETVSIYSVLSDSMVDLKVLDKYCIGQDLYLELDLIIADCETPQTNMIFISGRGSNAGLIPFFDQDFCYSQLNCQWEEGSLLYSSSEDCLLLNDEDISISEMNLTVWPNPVSESINIIFSEDILSGSLSLKSIHGELVLQNAVQKSTQLNVSAFSSGIYILTFTSEQGQTFSEKVVIQK